jgi:outer membrane biosynthesis protein TonB
MFPGNGIAATSLYGYSGSMSSTPAATDEITHATIDTVDTVEAGPSPQPAPAEAPAVEPEPPVIEQPVIEPIVIEPVTPPPQPEPKPELAAEPVAETVPPKPEQPVQPPEPVQPSPQPQPATPPIIPQPAPAGDVPAAVLALTDAELRIAVAYYLRKHQTELSRKGVAARQENMRRNLDAIEAYVKKRGSAKIPRLTQEFNLSPVLVSKYVQTLVKQGHIKAEGHGSSRRYFV